MAIHRTASTAYARREPSPGCRLLLSSIQRIYHSSRPGLPGCVHIQSYYRLGESNLQELPCYLRYDLCICNTEIQSILYSLIVRYILCLNRNSVLVTAITSFFSIYSCILPIYLVAYSFQETSDCCYIAKHQGYHHLYRSFYYSRCNFVSMQVWCYAFSLLGKCVHCLFIGSNKAVLTAAFFLC